MFYMCFMMFYYVLECFMMFSESRNDRRRRIGARAAVDCLRDRDNSAEIGDNSSEIGDNSAEIGDGSVEIGNGAAGIVDIAANVIPC